MSDDLPKAYEPQEVEKRWYAFWEEGGFFRGDAASSKPSYCLVIPPPNVTGILHMGHALVNTLQDILCRWKRMQGFEALWVPGTDHAGISTQSIVEKHLFQTTGKRRCDFSREEFLEHVWAWKEKSETTILSQLRYLGCSCDWSRTRFTLDEGCSRAVRSMFKKLYDGRLIYRGYYLVNWDPVLQTAIADDEVEYEDREGSMWYIRYPLVDGTGHVTIATTRPEVMFGDMAVAVHPEDARYKALIGKKLYLPLTGREIPILADSFVDPEFGTGAVKITPAHDPNDYQMAQRHSLTCLNVLTPDACLNEVAGDFAGMKVAIARPAVVARLAEEGFLEKTERHQNRVGVSYRSKAVIEPYLSKQWFVKMSDFAKDLRAMVESGKVRLLPPHWDATYFHWIDNLRDWCISRQLWWGHRIPVWYRRDNPEVRLCYDGEGVPPEVEKDPDGWQQETDVLDTWFSSALWPFSTLGWPDVTADLTKFYPNSVLVTGHDILFFWVARMLFMGQYALDKPPFPEVFLHGLIYGKSYLKPSSGGEGMTYIGGEERDRYDRGTPLPKDVSYRWEKMSKTKGNVIDPIEIIQEYGADAIRMALCASATHARQIDLDRRRFEDFKNFANKMWNGARFIFMHLEGNADEGTLPLSREEFAKGLDRKLFSLEDRWILSTLNRVIDKVNHLLGSYAFDQAAVTAYDFFWKEFCAYYLEISKPILFGKVGTAALRANKQKLLACVLGASIRLIHPMAPFITEELFSRLKGRLGGLEAIVGADEYTQEALAALQAPACLVAPYPRLLCLEDLCPEIDEAFALMEEVVYAIRNLRGEMGLPPGQKTAIFISGPVGKERETLSLHADILHALLKIEALHFEDQAPHLAAASTACVGPLQITLPMPHELVAKEIARLQKRGEELSLGLAKTLQQLGNEEFCQKAPAHLVAKLEQQKVQQQNELALVQDKLALLGTPDNS